MTLKELIKILHGTNNSNVCKTGKCQVNAKYENNKSKEMEDKE